MPTATLPPLAETYSTQCGWLYPSIVPDYPAQVSLIRFTPVPVTRAAEYAAEGWPVPSCDVCGSEGPLWDWNDLWAGGVSVSGCECADCLHTYATDDLSVGCWVPSPLALTAG